MIYVIDAEKHLQMTSRMYENEGGYSIGNEIYKTVLEISVNGICVEILAFRDIHSQDFLDFVSEWVFEKYFRAYKEYSQAQAKDQVHLLN